MPITDPLVLPPDVMIIPVASLAPATRARLPAQGGPFAITRPSIRINSKLVSEHSANLLRRFETASKIIDAIAAYSRESNLDAEVVLEEAFPVLRDCFNDGFLVPADSPEATKVLPILARGDMVAGYRVNRLIQVYGEGELYQVSGAGDQVAVLKLLRPNHPDVFRTRFAREAAVLRHLEGRATPRLLDQGELEGQPFILMSWCAGVSPVPVADGIRAAADGVPSSELAKLCRAILHPYGILHGAGVIHGDVHPQNVLIDDKGSATLIDFGFARFAERNSEHVGRGGVAYFLDPAFAAALLEEINPPPATMEDDQYSVAALLYRLLTGDHYVDFRLDRTAMLRQIMTEAPLPFSARGVSPWPPVESVLARALSKERADRFPTMAAFEDAFATAAGESPPVESDPTDGTLIDAAEVRRRVIAGLTGQGGDRITVDDPSCSLSHGAAGLAYACYRLSCLERDPALLAQADWWLAWAESHEGDDNAFAQPSGEITADTTGLRSPYHREGGLSAVRALLAQADGDLGGLSHAVAEFLKRSMPPDSEPDLTTGRSGTLLGAAVLLEATPGEAVETRRTLVDFGSAEAQAIWDQVSESEVGDGTGVANLGLAHGWAGILYAQLRWHQVTGSPLPPRFLERLSQLADLAEPVGRGVCWPWVMGGGSEGSVGSGDGGGGGAAGQRGRDTSEGGGGSGGVNSEGGRAAGQRGGEGGGVRTMPGWCNGSAGFVFLWTRAARVLGEPRFLELARLAAWDVFDHPATVPHLCCGLGGRAYALLAMYRYSGDPAWLERGRALAARAFRGRWPDGDALSQQSLYRGEVGLALLAADLAKPERASMPFFEAEGWPSGVVASHL